MAYASQSGRARTSPSNPQAFAVCDRCGMWYNRVNLRWQFDWRGATIQNTRVLVCDPCYDTPQAQLRAIVVPADPVPIIQPRIEPFAADETDYQTISAETVYDPVTGIPIPSKTTLLAEDGESLTTQPIGPPVGLGQNAVMPLYLGEPYGVQIPLLSVTSNGTDQIAVTCSEPHGLSTNDQISVEGLEDSRADGFYSVTVTTATAFTYQVNRAIPTAALLGSNTNMITVLVGLPYGYPEIPQTGI